MDCLTNLAYCAIFIMIKYYSLSLRLFIRSENFVSGSHEYPLGLLRSRNLLRTYRGHVPFLLPGKLNNLGFSAPSRQVSVSNFPQLISLFFVPLPYVLWYPNKSNFVYQMSDRGLMQSQTSSSVEVFASAWLCEVRLYICC